MLAGLMVFGITQGRNWVDMCIAQANPKDWTLIQLSRAGKSSTRRRRNGWPLTIEPNQGFVGGIILLEESGWIDLVDAKSTLRRLVKLPLGQSREWDRVAVDPSRRLVAVLNPMSEYGDGCSLIVFDAASKKIIVNLRDRGLLSRLGLKLTQEPVACAGWNPGVAFSPDGRTLAVSMADPSTVLQGTEYHDPIVKTVLLNLADGSVRRLSTEGGVLGFTSASDLVLWRAKTEGSTLYTLNLKTGTKSSLGACNYPILSGGVVFDLKLDPSKRRLEGVCLMDLRAKRTKVIAAPRGLTWLSPFPPVRDDPDFGPLFPQYAFSLNHD
jgi:hypothetical protein